MNLIPRAYVRQRSGLHLNLLDPSPQGWTDDDLAIGLSRTFRWGGHSIWPLPLSVAQHSLTVLALACTGAKEAMTHQQALRELLHDADEALIGGFDPISPLKPFLGPAFPELTKQLQAAVFTRYNLANWTDAEFKKHKHADILAAASEAVHKTGPEPAQQPTNAQPTQRRQKRSHCPPFPAQTHCYQHSASSSSKDSSRKLRVGLLNLLQQKFIKCCTKA